MGGILMPDKKNNGIKIRRNGERSGVGLVLSALLCLAFVPMVGLAIDGSIAYMMRLKVSTALDAAVSAGARSLNIGATQAAQSASAIAAATSVFNADLPTTQDWGVNMVGPGLGLTVSSPVPAAGAYMRIVTATANATIPTTFMSILGSTFSTTKIGLTATAQRRNLNVVLVLDHSGSMSSVITQMDTDASDFVQMFAGGTDNVGLVTFAGSAFVAFSPSTSFLSASPSVPAMINTIATYDGGTNTASAIWYAYQQLITLNQPGAVNVIVLFTDGRANNFTADFTSLISPLAGCTITPPLIGNIGSDTGEVSLFGLFDWTQTSINDISEGRPAPGSGGCALISNSGPSASYPDFTPNWNIGTYITALPAADINGNSTNGTGSIGAYAPVTLTQVNPVNVTNAGQNALDDAANKIRNDTTIRPQIFAIGLGNNPGLPPDPVLLARVANDPTSESYNTAQPTGLYVFSPTIAQLHAAFLRVASQVLRLSQ
jgi:Flp pilus assembly protein TadG